MTRIAPMLLLLAALVAQAAKPEPLTYKLGGRRYVVALPDSQLWSVVEFARVAKADGAKLFIDGKEVRRARVRGDSYDKFGRNYLVVVMRTGKRLSPPAKKTESGQVGKWESGSLPLPPKVMARSLSLSPPPTFPLSVPVTLHLSWPDVTGYTPGGWGSGPMVMPDGGPRWWGVYSTDDFRTERFENRVTEPSCTVTGAVPHRFYVVRWRG